MPLPEYKQLVDEAKREIKEIDPAELKQMQQSQQNFTLIDVREPDEVAQGAIAGAETLPNRLLLRWRWTLRPGRADAEAHGLQERYVACRRI